MEGLIQQLINMVKDASPQLWEMAVRQLMIKNITDAVWASICLSLLTLILIIIVKGVNKHKDYEREWDVKTHEYVNVGPWDGSWNEEMLMYVFIGGLIALIPAGVVIANVTELVGRLFNPNYYALYILMDLVRNTVK